MRISNRTKVKDKEAIILKEAIQIVREFNRDNSQYTFTMDINAGYECVCTITVAHTNGVFYSTFTQTLWNGYFRAIRQCINHAKTNPTYKPLVGEEWVKRKINQLMLDYPNFVKRFDF